MIRNNLICVAAMALALAAPALAETSREASERVLPADGIKGVRVVNSRGRVILKPSADGRLHLKALKILRGTAAERKRLSAETRVETDESQGVFVVRATYRQHTTIRVNLWDIFSGLELPRAQVEITLEVPGSLPVQVNCSSGDVETADLLGPQQIATSSGDVELHDPRGPVEITSSSGDISGSGLGPTGIRTTSGDVVLERTRGPITARTSSGDVTVRGAQDSLRIGTVSGDVMVEGAPRGLTVSTSSGEVVVHDVASRVSIESSSGDIEATLDAPFGFGRITTSSGDVGVRLAHAVGCTLELRTSSGTLDVSAAVQVREVSRHSLSATIGRGGNPLTLRTTSGDIHVASGGD